MMINRDNLREYRTQLSDAYNVSKRVRQGPLFINDLAIYLNLEDIFIKEEKLEVSCIEIL